jgi:hypothetical protein
MDLAMAMCKIYDPGIPLVEPADQRVRIAKVAVSIAAQLFSTEDGEALVVEASHVNAAVSFMAMLYNKPSFSYDKWSIMQQLERTIADEDEVVSILDDMFGDQRTMMADRMCRLHDFTLGVFANSFSFSAINAQRHFQRLSVNRCFRPARGSRSELYEITPQFTKLLQRYAEANKRVGL